MFICPSLRLSYLLFPCENSRTRELRPSSFLPFSSCHIWFSRGTFHSRQKLFSMPSPLCFCSCLLVPGLRGMIILMILSLFPQYHLFSILYIFHETVTPISSMLRLFYASRIAGRIKSASFSLSFKDLHILPQTIFSVFWEEIPPEIFSKLI